MAHKDTTQLLRELQSLKKKVKIGDKYSHYKHPDKFYRIVALGFIESTEEPSVVYQAEYGEKMTWIRTEKEFFSKATLEDGTKVDRFRKAE